MDRGYVSLDSADGSGRKFWKRLDANMKVCMVGHGPSLQQGRRGKEIDDHDKVVRQKRSKPLLKFPKQYGSRTDYACYSWKLVQIEEIDLPAREFWAFIDSRFAKLPDEEIEAMQAAKQFPSAPKRS